MFESLFGEPEQFDVRSASSLGPEHELFDYATRYWAFHFRLCEAGESSSLHSLVMNFYAVLKRRRWLGYLHIASESLDGYPAHFDPLVVSCYLGHHTVTRSILDNHGGEIDSLALALYWSAVSGSAHCVQLVMDKLPSELQDSSLYPSRRFPIAAAAANGHLRSVEIFLEAGVFDINARDSHGMTAFSLAVRRAHVDMVQKLLSLPASTQLQLNIPDNKGHTALFWAVSIRSLNLVRVLLMDGRVDMNILDDKKSCAVSWACDEGLADIVSLFIQSKQVNLSSQDAHGNTPLIYAVKSRDFDTVKSLLRSRRYVGDIRHHLNFSARDLQGRNAISWAAAIADDRILALLLEYGSSDANTMDNDGWPPLAWTVDPPGYPNNAVKLLDHCREHINDLDSNGSSLLSSAIRWGQCEIARLLVKNTDININSYDNRGRTALSLAAAGGSLDTVKMLIEAGADPNIADNNGIIPFQRATNAQILNYIEHYTNPAAC